MKLTLTQEWTEAEVKQLMLNCRQLNTIGHVLQHYNIAVVCPSRNGWSSIGAMLWSHRNSFLPLKNGRNYIGVVDKEEIATGIRKKIDEIAAQEDDDENLEENN